MNILVYTTIYPIKGTKAGFTPIVKYFCEEWVLQGHKVVVISSSTRFPFIYYVTPNYIVKYFESKRGFNFPNILSRKKIKTIENGVNIYQLPISKKIPGQFPTSRIIENNFEEVVKYLESIAFIPNIAIGHWVAPQAHFLSLSKQYFNCRTALTLQSNVNDWEVKHLKQVKPGLDCLGFRSKTIKLSLKNKIDLSKQKQYLCYSGVKDYYDIANKKYTPKLREANKLKICFVGNLIGRKYPEKIIEALNMLKGVSTVFETHFVGEGILKNKIIKMDKLANINSTIYGRLPRQKVYEILNSCDVLVMISKNETFGLVYLEAMLNRVIPIASYNEGFDGIIKNGENGFLCNAGNALELSQLFENILTIKEEKYLNIQKNAFETAVNMTDDKMAEEYLNNVL